MDVYLWFVMAGIAIFASQLDGKRLPKIGLLLGGFIAFGEGISTLVNR